MLRMIKAELYKLFKSRTFKVLIIVSLLLMTLDIAMPMIMNEEFMTESTGMTMEEYNSVMDNYENEDSIINPGQIGVQMVGAENEFDIKPYEVYHMAFGSGIMEILIAVLVGTMVAKEYSEGTIKNTLAYGKKRSHFYLAKYLANIVGMIIIMAIMTVGSTIGLTILKGWGKAFEISQLLDMAKTFVGAIVVFGAVLALIMFIATLVRSNGATIGISVALFMIIPTLVAFMYGNYEWFDKIYEATLYYNSTLVTHIKASNSDIIKAVSIGAVWLVSSLLAGVGVFKAQEIK